MYQADRINQTTPSRDSECGYRRARHRRSSLRRRNRPGERRGQVHTFLHASVGCLISICSFVCADGMDREETYPDKSCTMANHHRGPTAGSHWEDLCSSASICSHSSDEEMKPAGHGKGELYAHRVDTRDFPPAAVNPLPHSGPSAGMGPPVDLGAPPFSGKNHPTYNPFLHRNIRFQHLPPDVLGTSCLL